MHGDAQAKTWAERGGQGECASFATNVHTCPYFKSLSDFLFESGAAPVTEKGVACQLRSHAPPGSPRVGEGLRGESDGAY